VVTQEVQNSSSTVGFAVGKYGDCLAKRGAAKVVGVRPATTVNAIEPRSNIDQLGTMLHKIGINDLLFGLRTCIGTVCQDSALSLSELTTHWPHDGVCDHRNQGCAWAVKIPDSTVFYVQHF
jgi:hypothetical protein